MRVAHRTGVEGRRGPRLRLGRQHRRADGRRALRAEDARRHRPAGDRHRDAERSDGYTTVLDLGANVDCTAEHLLQFAVMGSALVSAVDGKDDPTVGLLNIGEEAIKGSETIKRAGELLRAAAEPATSTSTATSKATTSSRARPTSSSAMASSATSR